MTIIYYDGRKELAREIEFCSDRPALIVNGWHVIPLVEIVRIVKGDR